jgi:hypothetical protein
MTLQPSVLMVRAAVLGFVEPHEPKQAIGENHGEEAGVLLALPPSWPTATSDIRIGWLTNCRNTAIVDT